MSGDPLTPTRMVHVRTVTTPFHARVIAARLGAEGIVTELRGNVGNGPYPFGSSSVWVPEADVDTAAEILLADEVEAAFALGPDDEEPRVPPRLVLGLTSRQLFAVGGLLLMLFATFVSHLGL